MLIESNLSSVQASSFRLQTEFTITMNLVDMRLALLRLIFVAIICPFLTSGQSTEQSDQFVEPVKVAIACGDHAEPTLDYRVSLSSFNDSCQKLSFSCEAEYPTEWVHNLDKERSGKLIEREEWTEWTNSWGKKWAKDQLYAARLDLKFSNVRNDEDFLCRSMGNKSNNVLVQLKHEPTSNSSGKGKHRLIVTQLHNAKVADGVPKDTSPTEKYPVTFLVARTSSEYWWMCLPPNTSLAEAAAADTKSEMWFFKSDTAAHAANIHRLARLAPAQVKMIDWNDVPFGLRKHRPLGQRYSPGVALCENEELKIRAALEYFYVKNHTSDLWTMRFSLDEIQMKDLIWIEYGLATADNSTVPKSDPRAGSLIYYTNDTLDTRCSVYKYGFANSREFSISFNGSDPFAFDEYMGYENEGRDSWESNTIELRLGERGVGTYTLQCVAHVWNKDEVANQTVKLEVRTATPPYFESPHENLAFAEGNKNASVHCDAHGDPLPVVTWNPVPGSVPAMHGGEHDEFVLTSVSAKYHDGLPISCTARNRFGSEATKTFNLEVSRARGQGNGSGGLIIALSCMSLLRLS